MWARIAEIATGCWLLLSPAIFDSSGGLDRITGALVVLLALASFWHPLRHAHLLIAVIGAGLVVHALFTPYPAPPSIQNDLLVGLLAAMLAIIPNHALSPPDSWRDIPTTPPRSD